MQKKNKKQLNLIIYHQLVFSTKFLKRTKRNFEIQEFYQNKSKSWFFFIICHCVVHRFINNDWVFFTSRFSFILFSPLISLIILIFVLPSGIQIMYNLDFHNLFFVSLRGYFIMLMSSFFSSGFW